MLRIATTLKVRTLQLQDRMIDAARRNRDEGAGAVEYILVTLGGLILVGVVFAALRAFAAAQAGNLRSPL
jgi:hypothetical protein